MNAEFCFPETLVFNPLRHLLNGLANCIAMSRRRPDCERAVSVPGGGVPDHFNQTISLEAA